MQKGNRSKNKNFKKNSSKVRADKEEQKGNNSYFKQQEQEKEEEEGELCLLCAEVMTWAAVGRCNHPICHLCVLRMRVKNDDKHCPVCKDDSDVVVVYRHPSPVACSTSTAAVTFESFNLDIHALESPLPGVEVLPKAQMLYVDAHDCFVSAGKLVALTCPQCGTRCRSDKALHQHVKEQHRMQFCHLCYTHRPLFTSEMRLMTSVQLQAHMDASIASSSSASSSAGEKGKRKKTPKAVAKGEGEAVAAGHQVSSLT